MNRLKKLKGFNVDLRTPGLDYTALRFANEGWGRDNVDKIIETLHRSHISTQAIVDDLMKYDRKYAKGIVRDDPVYQLVLESVRQSLIPEDKLIPLTLGGAEQHPDFPKDRSPGLPWKEKGYKTKGDVLKDPKARKVWHIKWHNIGRGRKETLPDTALYCRSQIARVGEEKIRAVWGLPIDVIVEEARFFYPYIEWIKGSSPNIPIAYQTEMATGGMGYINDMLKSYPNYNYTMTDWSKFDKTIPPWLIRDAFDVILNSFDLSKVKDSESLIWNVDVEHTLRRFKKMVKYFINTPVRVHTGDRFQKSGGVPSGSMFTNILDSIVNMIVSRYIIYQTVGELPNAEMYLGDDGVLITQKPINLTDMGKLAEEKFGMLLNVKKSYTTTKPYNVHFLGYFNKDGLPYKPQDFLIASFIYPERVVKDNLLRITRAVGQMWSTLDAHAAKKWHELVTKMLEHYGVSASVIEELIREHPGHFKYIRILGIPIEEITVPTLVQDVVARVEPTRTPKRKFKKYTWNYVELMEAVATRTGYTCEDT